ncbi:MFS transporter [Alteromonas sp. CYL-A6]|uniref:MFS transporter n=1 Tax=Alteromonas nitratireducens TaxID=3390813 RepID=UPI0034BA384E
MAFPLLFSALLATAIGQSVVLTILPSLGRDTGLSEIQVAIMMSASAFIFALGTTLWSRFARKKGYKFTLMMGLTGYTLGTALYAGVWSFGYSGLLSGTVLFIALLVSRSLQSTIMSATPPSAVGYAIAISAPDKRVGAISKVTSANNLGQIVGPAYAGLLAGFGLLTPLYTIVLLTLCALVVIWWKLPVLSPQQAGSSQAHQPQAEPGQVRGITPILIGTCAALFCCMAMMQQTLGFFFIDHYHFTTVEAAQHVGVAMMCTAAASLGIQLLVVQRARIRSQSMIYLSLPLLVSAYLVMFIHQSLAVLYVAMVMMGAGMGMAYPSVAAVATSYCHPDRQATVTGMITATPAMGYIVGPPIAAWLYGYGQRWPFLCASLLLVFFILLVSVALRTLKAQEATR